MKTSERFTASEAAYVLNEKLKNVTKLLDERKLTEKVVRKGIHVRVINKSDLIFMFAFREMRHDLSPQGRAKFFDAIRSGTIHRKNAVVFGPISIDLKNAEQELDKRLSEYEALKAYISTDSGEPLLKGTGIEVYRIFSLIAGGMSDEEILDDYPSMGNKQLEAVKAFAIANPKPGRPYPKATLKKSIKNLGLGDLEELLRQAESDE